MDRVTNTGNVQRGGGKKGKGEGGEGGRRGRRGRKGRRGGEGFLKLGGVIRL